MSNSTTGRYKNFNQGAAIVSKGALQSANMGELEVLNIASGTNPAGSLYYHNGTVEAALVGDTFVQTLTNKILHNDSADTIFGVAGGPFSLVSAAGENLVLQAGTAGLLQFITSYTLTLPTSAPATDTSLTFNGTSYIWQPNAFTNASAIFASNSGHTYLTGTNVQAQLDETDAELVAIAGGTVTAASVTASNAGHTYLTGANVQLQLDETDAELVTQQTEITAFSSSTHVAPGAGLVGADNTGHTYLTGSTVQAQLDETDAELAVLAGEIPTVDNVTLQDISNVFSVKPLGISDAQIANATITNDKLAPLNYAQSPSSGVSSAPSSISYTNIWAAQTLTTSGRPVSIKIISDGSSNLAYILGYGGMQFIRDGIAISGWYSIGDYSSHVPGILTSMEVIDTYPLPGVHTYEVQYITEPLATLTVNYMSMFIQEL